MGSKRSKPSNEDTVAISADSLAQLFAAKEQEANHRMAQELSSRCLQVRFQEALAEQLGRMTDLAELSAFLLQELRRVLGGEHAVLAVVAESQFLEVVAMTGPVLQPYQQDLLEEAFIAGESLAIGGTDGDSLFAMGTSALPAGVPLLAIPLARHDQKPLGVLLIEGALHADKADWLPGYLTTVSLALEDCMHYAQIEQLIFDAVLAMALDHEGRQTGMAGHCHRVEELARQLARGLGLTASETKHVRMLALVHDLTPEAVARAFSSLKRGKLTSQAWQALMADPFVGGIYPSPLANFQRVLDDLAFLHCRWDGKGNVPGRRGDELPLAARVVAVAEAFEHLTGARAHRTTMPFAQALAELRRYAGAQYDPRVVEALCLQFASLEMEVRIARLPISERE